ncbi:hypothetical protein ACFSCX_03250 [Bacillus salitolerans]|uniref:Nuclear transport factor 2 family protein n=1 Tax=Bacillus salitolerans TaxID=1437434 RepID=A0ABW4LKD1_9BACI
MSKKTSLFSFLLVLMLMLSACGGGSESASGEASSDDPIETVVNKYVEAINLEDIDHLLKTIHPFSAQHIELRGYYDKDFAQFDYEVKKVSSTVKEKLDDKVVVELVFSKALLTEKAEGPNELKEGEFTQTLTLKTKGEEWVIDKVE